MDHILQNVVGENKISRMDGFLRYNQVEMHLMYDKITFGLINAGDTFKRAMDISFEGEKDKFIVIYLDDMTVFSKIDKDHIKHLRQTFMKCRKFGLSLNTKKSYFSMTEGKILGHIVSKEGVKIDLERVEAIKKISFPVKMRICDVNGPCGKGQ